MFFEMSHTSIGPAGKLILRAGSFFHTSYVLIALMIIIIIIVIIIIIIIMKNFYSRNSHGPHSSKRRDMF